MANEKCASCGHAIGQKESAHVHRERVYCAGCIQMIEPPVPIHYARPTPSEPKSRPCRPERSFVALMMIFGVLGIFGAVIIPTLIWIQLPRPTINGIPIEPSKLPYTLASFAMFTLSLCLMALAKIVELLGNLIRKP